MDITETLCQRVHAWEIHEEYAARITHGFPFQGLPRVPCAQVNHYSLLAEFWYDPEEGHIKVAHQDLHSAVIDLQLKPIPKV